MQVDKVSDYGFPDTSSLAAWKLVTDLTEEERFILNGILGRNSGSDVRVWVLLKPKEE